MEVTKISVKKAVEKIKSQEYVIPAIQRSFVWDTEKIEHLFDSLLREYPIGNLLFWKMDSSFIDEQDHFYGFIKDYNARDKKDNPQVMAKDLNKSSTIAILDGQQRLTAMYLGLHGSYNAKKKYMPKDSDNSFERLYLYLNLLRERKDEESEVKYDFRFLPNDSLTEEAETTWLKVGDILNPSIYFSLNSEKSKYKRIAELLNKSGEEGKFALETISKLQEALTEERIIYHEDKSKGIDEVLDIFVRTNSGGKPLSKADLLLSTCTAHWKNPHARDEVNNLVEILNDKKIFNFDINFIIKSFLVLCDTEIEFKVKNFKRNNVRTIEDNLNGIKQSLEITIKLAAQIGFNKYNLTSHNVLIPVAYYIFKNIKNKKLTDSSNVSEENLKNIQNWIVRALLKGIFGSSTDSTLKKSRDTIKNSKLDVFPWEHLLYDFRNKNLDFGIEEVEGFLKDKKKNFLILSLLYPKKIISKKEIIDIDHIFPRACFKRMKNLSKDYIKECKSRQNGIGNLQFLEMNENRKVKTDQMPTEWLGNEKEIKKWKENNYAKILPDSMEHFVNFYNERENLMKEALLKIIGVKNKTK